MLEYVSTLPVETGRCLVWLTWIQIEEDFYINRNEFLPSKIIHRIIFEVTLCLQLARENFLQEKKFSHFQKCACTDEGLSLVATSAKGLCPFETHHLL